jgi:TM2 domain-containing membrane protein YozV
MHGTFTQKIILCLIMAFLTAGLFEWGKLFIEGADDALNKGYQHKSPLQVTSGH